MKVSSYWSDTPITSNSASGVCDSSEQSGRSRARSSASMSTQGQKQRSHAMRGSAFKTE